MHYNEKPTICMHPVKYIDVYCTCKGRHSNIYPPSHTVHLCTYGCMSYQPISNFCLLFRQAGHSASPPPEMRMSGAPITRGGDWCDWWISSNSSYPDSFETLENELSHFGSLDSSHVMKHQPLGWIAHSLPWLHVWKGKFPRA